MFDWYKSNREKIFVLQSIKLQEPYCCLKEEYVPIYIPSRYSKWTNISLLKSSIIYNLFPQLFAINHHLSNAEEAKAQKY